MSAHRPWSDQSTLRSAQGKQSMRLPDALQSADDTAALGYLNRYYHCTVGARKRFTGAEFDGWDSTGARAVHADRFTADDLIAITFLSVHVRAVQASQMFSDPSDPGQV